MAGLLTCAGRAARSTEWGGDSHRTEPLCNPPVARPRGSRSLARTGGVCVGGLPPEKRQDRNASIRARNLHRLSSVHRGTTAAGRLASPRTRTIARRTAPGRARAHAHRVLQRAVARRVPERALVRLARRRPTEDRSLATPADLCGASARPCR